MVSTPCIRLCVLDPASGLCQGCGRSVDEIAAWATLDEPTRRRIMATLDMRRTGGSSEPAAGERSDRATGRMS